MARTDQIVLYLTANIASNYGVIWVNRGCFLDTVTYKYFLLHILK